MKKNFVNPAEIEFKEESVVVVNRVSKATTGGRAMSFNSVVAVGDGNGSVGIGFGKAKEVAAAVNKAREDAKKNLFKVPIINGTIPHRVDVKFNAVRLMLKPASSGTGIIAGGPVRAIMEQVGITDILTKNTGSTNSINVVKAVVKGLKELRDAFMIAKFRNVKVDELFN